MRILFLVSILLISLNTHSQRNTAKALQQEVSSKEIVQSVFPTAVKVVKVDKYWYSIVDIQNKKLGFAMYSQLFCNDVIGYTDRTPVVIITDMKFLIKKVALLTNSESPGYIRRLERNGFFNLWNGKTVQKAKAIEIDGYTGATMTARAVEKNVKFLLENGGKKLPKK